MVGTAINAGSECWGIGFTREDVVALLNEEPEAMNKFNHEERCENLSDYIKRLRLCVKWFPEIEAVYAQEQDRLRVALDSAEQRLGEMELLSKNKEEEHCCVIVDLRKNLASAQEKLAREQTERLAAVDSLAKERDGRLTNEKILASVSYELTKAQQELLTSNQMLAAVNDMDRKLQEYNTSLQEYYCKLQVDLNMANENIKRCEKEKAAVVEDLSGVRGHYNSIQEQFASLKVSHDEASKQKEVLASKVTCLRGDLHQVRDERDRYRSQVEVLTDEVTKYKEYTGRSAAELGTLTIKSNELEAKCLSQSEEIEVLLEKLTFAKRRLEVCDLSAVELKAETEEQKELICQLQTRLSEAELRKKLHNTILEMLTSAQ